MNPQENQNENVDLMAVSPDQSKMFEDSEGPTRIEISHDDGSMMGEAEAVACPPQTENVFSVSKVKILAALAIVASAAYIAYWVQEPTQIKTDVLSDSATTTAASTTDSAADSLESALGETKDSEVTTSTVASTASEKTSNVELSLYGFEPAVLKIEKNTKVIWTNGSPEEQTIVGSLSDGSSFTSKALKAGESFEYLFENDADVEYYSTYNPALKAIITVGKGKSAAASTTTSNTDDTKAETSEIDTMSTTSTTTTSAPTSTATSIDTMTVKSTDTETELKPAADDKGMSEVKKEMTEAEKATEALEEVAMKGAADKNSKTMSKTGPEDILYLVAFGAIAYFNRKKLKLIQFLK